MASVREQVLTALFNLLKSIETDDLNVFRNPDKEMETPSEGLVFMFDGDPGEPEVDFSPVAYHYDHAVEIEVLFAHEDALVRATGIDAVLSKISTALESDQSLGGLVAYMEPSAPNLSGEEIDGGITEELATFQITLSYSTENPLK